MFTLFINLVKSNPWTAYWVAWILAFIIPEFIALAKPGKGDTLSEQVWMLYDNSTFGKFATWMLSALLIWSIVHFITRGRYA